MKQTYDFRAFILPLLTLLSGVWLLSPVQAAQTEDPITLINSSLTTQAEAGRFSGSVLIALGDEILLSEGYNLANREWGIPNTADTRFPIGDISKQFVALAILMLEERGSLTLQDPLCQYIEECPPAWENITIEHLLTHTSGMPAIDLAGGSTLLSPERAIERLAEEELRFEPGTEMQYSSTGYMVLLHIIEQISGERYDDFFQENIFEPLGMANTGVDHITNVIGQRAEGYASATARNPPIANLAYSQLGPFYSTVGDLFLWNQALYGGEFVSDAMRETMLEAAAQNPTLGWGGAIGLFNDTELYPGYNGVVHSVFSAAAFAGCLVHLPDDNMDIVILKNFDPVRQHPCSVAGLLVFTYFLGT